MLTDYVNMEHMKNANMSQHFSANNAFDFDCKANSLDYESKDFYQSSLEGKKS